MVNLDAGTFRCFACGAKGGVLDALQLLGVADREEAREEAASFGIEVGRARRREPLPGLHRSAASEPAKQRSDSEQIDWDALPAAPDTKRRREWVYLDERSEQVGRVVRLDLADGGKRIWQERRQGDRFIAGMEGIVLPLYRLPEVRKRARTARRILVVEGEKVVDALDRLGAFATTNPGGAGKWRPEYTGSLRGASVTVIADCDLEGRRHALRVTQELLAGGIAVSDPLDPDPFRHDGYDMADYLADVAKTVRGVTPDVSRWRVRFMLADHLRGMLNHCLPASADGLVRKLERLDHDASPAQRPMRLCPACQRERPHRLAGGLAYCPCGGFHPVAVGGGL